jgi:hypothetical protein
LKTKIKEKKGRKAKDDMEALWNRLKLNEKI